jgi:DNA repair exonuclease SbcCD nuclease subunit
MRFAHIADTHIRNLKYHYEYKEVFKQLYESLINEKVDYIIHCGDIAHTKTQISPEFVQMAADFFTNLASIAPTYIILGNHDGNLKNSSRQDALTPIVDALNLQNLYLLKNAGETKLNDRFCLNVLSVFDEDNWVSPTNVDAINIALYHGAIDRSKTDLNWTLGGDHDVSIFDDFDFAFLGDIHKTQKLDKEGRIWYAGSTVQQNFGESLDKGYLLWDIEDKNDFSCKHIAFVNPKPFFTIELTPKGQVPRKVKPPVGARLRLVSNSNIPLDKVRKAISVAKHNFKPESVTYLNRAATRRVSIEDSTKNLNQEDLRDISVQEKLIKEYLKDYEVESDVMKKVLQLNQRYSSLVEENEEVARNVNWDLKKVEWDYLFNYGESNIINFEKLNGIVGIFGKNFSGKSSIVDSFLYTLYNSVSKSVRKNLNIINQNSDYGKGKVTITVDDKDYVIERSSEKYIKKLRGEETLEAKTDTEFYSLDLMGEKEILNGMSRQDTDKNIRRLFGTIDDFLMTSMASQLDSLTFINEGSTKRKEILAKFLDLEVFDRKFKMAKEDSQETKAMLKKLEGVDYESEISSVQFSLDQNELKTERNKNTCNQLKQEMLVLDENIRNIQLEIDSVPTELIDINLITDKLNKCQNKIQNLYSENESLQDVIGQNQLLFTKIIDFIEEFKVEEYESKKDFIDGKKDDLSRALQSISQETDKITLYKKKLNLLEEVPCGSEYSHCKFIKDAYGAKDLLQISESKIAKTSIVVNDLGKEIYESEPEKVEEYLNKYNQLLEKKNGIASSVASDQVTLEKNKSSILKLRVEIDSLKDKSETYFQNKELIDNLEVLMDRRSKETSKRNEMQKNYDSCQEDLASLYRQHGSLEQKLINLNEDKRNLEELSSEYSAYDLLMTCCHTNGISYDVIKKRLPLINSEISKILTNIVEFEIFIENDEKKINIFIKHPKHDPRPLELGSGAEKTIASMAIRLAFLTVSNLPKPDVFILDEPGTALDEENMEGFIRILDMVKSYFKTVILISHLDSLKDCVDQQIIIDKNNGYAYVNV